MKYLSKFGLYVDNDCNIYSKNRYGKLFVVPIGLGGTKGKYNIVTYYKCDENGNRIGNKQVHAYVHIVLATAFIPNPENKPTVDHINRDSKDNRLSNLRWATLKEQQANRKVSIEAKTKYGVRPCDDKKLYEHNRRIYNKLAA